MLKLLLYRNINKVREKVMGTFSKRSAALADLNNLFGETNLNLVSKQRKSIYDYFRSFRIEFKVLLSMMYTLNNKPKYIIFYVERIYILFIQ